MNSRWSVRIRGSYVDFVFVRLGISRIVPFDRMSVPFSFQTAPGATL